MYINWEGPLITINPEHGTDLQPGGNSPKGIKVPNYGHFGGPLISGENDDPGVDSLDALFKTHDTNIGQGLLEAHAELIGGILALDDPDGPFLEVERASGEIVADPEATLYGGFTLFALTAQVMQLDVDNPGLLGLFEAELAEFDPALNVSTVLTKAAEYMETGLEAVPANEAKGLNGLFHIWEHQFDIA